MMITEIKESIKNNMNKQLSFKISGARNQIEKFNGKIIGLYNSVFLVKDIDSGITRSFSYSDVLTKSLIIYFK